MPLAIRVKARYEDKVLKPLEEVELEEGDEVEISIVPKVKKLLKSKVTKTRSSKGYGGRLRIPSNSRDLEKIYLSGILNRISPSDKFGSFLYCVAEK